MEKKKVLIGLVLFLVLFFPFDPSVILNRLVGIPIHILMYLLAFGALVYFIEGKTLKEKWSNAIKSIKKVLN
jgi:hypothetical protein